MKTTFCCRDVVFYHSETTPGKVAVVEAQFDQKQDYRHFFIFADAFGTTCSLRTKNKKKYC